MPVHFDFQAIDFESPHKEIDHSAWVFNSLRELRSMLGSCELTVEEYDHSLMYIQAVASTLWTIPAFDRPAFLIALFHDLRLFHRFLVSRVPTRRLPVISPKLRLPVFFVEHADDTPPDIPVNGRDRA